MWPRDCYLTSPGTKPPPINIVSIGKACPSSKYQYRNDILEPYLFVSWELPVLRTGELNHSALPAAEGRHSFPSAWSHWLAFLSFPGAARTFRRYYLLGQSSLRTSGKWWESWFQSLISSVGGKEVGRDQLALGSSEFRRAILGLPVLDHLLTLLVCISIIYRILPTL